MIRAFLSLLSVLGLALLLPACVGWLRPQGKRVELNPDEATRFVHFLDEVHETDVDRAPLKAAMAGWSPTVPAWDDLSPAHAGRITSWLETATQRLADEFPNRGNAIEAPLYASAQTWLRWERAAIGWKDHSDLLSDAEGAHRLPTRYLWEVARPQSVAEWDHYVALLDSLPGYLGQLEDRLRTRAALRTLPPRQVLMRARTRCLAWLAGRPFTSLSSIQSPWQTHALERLEASTQLSQAERNRIADAINRALAQSVGPAYQSLAATLDNLNSQAPEEIGVAARTDGPTWYAYRLERIAGEPVDPADAHSLGLREVSRLRERLREWQQAAGVTETTNAWLQTLREGEDYPRADREAWSLAAERWIATSQERLDLAMPGLLLTPLPIQILAADPDGSSPPLEYQPRDPALEVHPGDWVSIPALCMEAWLAQSSVPGAHLRSAHTLPAKPLPILMRTMELPSLEAGWDLYATRLALEWRLYSGPEAELGQILCELWWAAQLVVDTGIHHRSWTQEESEQYLANNSVFRRSLCQNAVRDIMERPGARAAATLGLQQLQDLQTRAETALGPNLDLNAFHRALLERGPLPIGPLRERMQAWINERLAKR